MKHFWTKVNIKLLLLSCFMFLQTASYAQGGVRISINNRNITIIEALQEIEKQSEMSVAYNNSKLNGDKHIQLNLSNQTLDQALTTILDDTGFDYKLKDEYIIIVPEKQQQTDRKIITGKVVDETGAALVGATINVDGSNTGTFTNADGTFSLTASRASVISISFVGYVTQRINITDQSTYSITMVPLNQDLDAVVITALGIKRSQKALSYNVQEIKQDELTRVKDANFINSLAGKIAGVTINSSSSGVGGASKVVMRGTKSIAQSSNALYVIDGVPIFNQPKEGGTEFSSAGSTEGIADLNPEDIESISVLTGAAAAALYGSRASNGAILVTTKKGVAGKTQVIVSSNVEFLRPFVMPKFQTKYGTGDFTTEAGSLSRSWGNLLNSSNYMGYSPRKNFMETGTVFTNSVSVSTGNDKNQTYFSGAAVNSEGIIPNNEYDRYNFTFRNTSKFFQDKMTLDISGSYVMQKDQNMVNQGIYSNPLVSAYLFPRGDDFDMTRIFERYDDESGIKKQYWPQSEGDFRMQNPYWIAHRNLKNNERKRYMLSAGLNYEILDWISVAGRVRVDNSNNDYTEKLYASTNETIAEGKNGYYGMTKTNEEQTYADAMLNINRTFDDFSFVAVAGGSISDMRTDELVTKGPIRANGIPNVFNVFNIDDVSKKTQQMGWKEQTQSIFASAEIGWRSTYYLTLTGRNDWASQLAGSSNTSFFYPSVGLSTVLSEAIKMPDAINYLKLRGSFSSVGIPYPRNLTTRTYSFNESDKIWETKTHYPIGNLKVERTDSWEVGITTRFLDHFNFDLSLYLANTANQTFDPQISVSSGYSTIYLQTGHVRNKGIEVAFSYSNKWGDVNWDSGLTFSMNKNEIVELVENYVHPETNEVINKDRLDIGGLARARFILKKGGSLGDLYSIADLQRDSNGKIYIDANGNPSVEYNIDDIKLGSVNPKYNLAWRNSVSWNGIHANALISARVGGIVYSATQAAMDLYGVSEASARDRDRGGVIVNGTDYVSAQAWYTAIGSQSGIPQYYTYSATNVRLQEASLGYTLPRNWVNDIADITISLVGRNLLMIYNKAPFDPEAIATTGNYYQGIDYFMMPNTRNIGFNLRVKF